MSVEAPDTAVMAGTGSPPTGLEAALAAALVEAEARQRPTLASVVVPVAARDPVALYEAAGALGLDAALLLRPSHRLGLVGLGEAWSVQAAGRMRFETVEHGWKDLLEVAVLPRGPIPRGAGPLILGGFGFADEPAISATWRGFEQARFVLPELLVTTAPGGSWLTASCVVGSSGSASRTAAALVGRWDAWLAAARPGSLRGSSSDPLRLVASRPDQHGWRDSVARLAGAVGRGRLDKAVLVRQVELLAAAPIDLPSVLHRLRSGAPESTVFAFGRGDRTFLGATPERLVSRRGREVRTVAMAGSAERSSDAGMDARLAEELLASDKEHEEHAVVVDMLRETLAPLMERLDISPAPSVVRLRHLQHLVTPVAGWLREPVDVIRLAALLHPTPAVAGAPRDLALELIAEEEPFERGWFGGPLGWVDRKGDGDLMVALRSGVVADRRAVLLAGCGIVADSEPDREWQESETKFQALGSALGGPWP